MHHKIMTTLSEFRHPPSLTLDTAKALQAMEWAENPCFSHESFQVSKTWVAVRLSAVTSLAGTFG